ncbi:MULTISPECIES: hypothetical protein [Oleiagrimonas]|jgi:hypothetical protein|uniref:Uncharacterized protein n=1 Tax=Oleiagrimonas citrea TaxID=1665687 RepID=A0A846ZJ49_9GAMM|nr:MULTISPECIES: hypothetical protein [Oleiagrimonas]NKZ37391.1 hypothetical protein [Oleiagrimonas citrea]
MKTVDGWIAAAGVVALVLAGMVVYRSRESSRVDSAEAIPPVHAPAPASSSFPSCVNVSPDKARWRCEVGVARRQHRIRCYGQRLYYVTKDASGKTSYRPWPAVLQCWNDADTSSH